MNQIAERNERRQKLPDVAALARCSRRESHRRRQGPRREREWAARSHAADFAATVEREGKACRVAAQKLHMHRRTLAAWCRRQRRGELTCQPRGRPCKESTVERRQVVIGLMRETGPRVGVPTLRVVFPEVPRCELTDLLRDYRREFQCLNRLAVEQLTWHSPGRVWAMDHAEPPSPIDNEYASVFSVRDLSSGMQLAWLPVPDETAKTTCDALLALFIEYGPPLVLKSDNGPPFKSHRLAATLDDWRVIPLRSPPVTPRYNGSCEAGIGAMKIRTHYRAAEQGRPGLWTCEDLEVARRRANEEHHPHGPTRPTPLGEWQSVAAIDCDERQRFHELVERIRRELEEDGSFAEKEIPTNDELAKLKRDVVRRALVEFGILSTKWRSITVPIKPR